MSLLFCFIFFFLHPKRIACAKLIKRFVLHAKKTAFVVEHDFIMATYLADRVIVYDGEPGIEVGVRCVLATRTVLLLGMTYCSGMIYSYL